MRSPKSAKTSSRSPKSITPQKSTATVSLNTQASKNCKKHLHLDYTDSPLMSQPPKRAVSFSSYNPNSTRRRSFLSASMLNHENYLVYEISSFDYDQPISFSCPFHGTNINRKPSNKLDKCTCPFSPRYSVSLNESQGFNWNQDLFANQYEQEKGVLCYNDTFDDNEEDIDTRMIIPRTRVFSYSLSHDEGNRDKVDVIDVEVDEDGIDF